MLAEIDWYRFLEPPLGAILLGGLVGVSHLVIGGHFWLRSRETRLKRVMVERGFSAAEIERVMRVSSPPPARYRSRSRAAVPADSG